MREKIIMDLSKKDVRAHAAACAQSAIYYMQVESYAFG